MRHFLNSDPAKDPDFHDRITSFIGGYKPYHSQAQLTLLYAEYKNNGVLGYPGGVLDQPDVYWDDIAWMRAVENWVEHIAPLASFGEVHRYESIFNRLERGEVM